MFLVTQTGLVVASQVTLTVSPFDCFRVVYAGGDRDDAGVTAVVASLLQVFQEQVGQQEVTCGRKIQGVSNGQQTSAEAATIFYSPYLC